MKMIEIVEAKPTDAGRRKRIDDWIEALFNAETVARAKAAADPNLKPRHFLINYRVGSENSAKMGTGADRRGALVEIIESLKPVEKHLSTSTWLVRLHIQEASDIRNHLIGPLDANLDGLHVTHASKTNRAAFGTSELRS
jgi:hypothetical protein